jgi:hypothetical protein
MTQVYRKYSNKRVNAEKEGIGFHLTFDEFKFLLNEAGITADDLGNTGYHLARYDDQGDYEIDNCRFIYYLENVREKKISDKSREASKRNMMNIHASRTREDYIRIGKLGGAVTGGQNKLKEDEINKRIQLINESGIDLMKYGWVKKVSELLGVTHTQVRRFMKKHYTGEYFVRKI